MSQVIDRQVFIKTKEKLDHLHLASHFAIEDLPLIAKLLAKLEEKGAEGFGKKFDETHQDTRECNQAEEALNVEVKRLVRENNGLRRDLWAAREAAQQLKVRLLQRSDVKLEKEMRQIDQIKILEDKDKRERTLLAENEQLRYKYNELMDLIHEDPHFERQYIKRLLKHKEIEKKYLVEESQIIVGKKVNGVTAADGGVFGEISLLKSKLLARQEEILRLQIIVEQNNNYVHYRFAETKKNRRETLLQEEVENLSHEIANLKNLLTANNIKIKANTKRQSSTTKMEFLNKKYENQFVVERKESEEYALEQPYSKQVKSPKPEKVKVKPKQNEQQIDEKVKEVKEAKPKIESKKKPDNTIQQSSQYFEAVVPSNEKQGDNKKPTIRYKSPQTPTVTQNSEKFLKGYTSNPKGQVKQHKQTKRAEQWPTKPAIKKQPAPPNPKEDKSAAFQKLLQQKNRRISQLEQQLKRHTPSRSTKIISAQNLNNNNNPSNNLIIKTNKNQYININNISHQDSEENKKRASKLESELARITKEKDKLEEKVRVLEREKAKHKEQAKVKKEEKPNREMERIEELQNAYENLQQKLAETQKLLLKANQHIYELQNLLNAAHQSYQNNHTAHQSYQNNRSTEKPPLTRQVEKYKETVVTDKNQVDQQRQFCSQQSNNNQLIIQQLRLQISFLHTEITRLQSQAGSYISQRESLLVRLRELQFNLQRQAQEMRYFEEHLFHQHSAQSAISELKEMQNQSDLSIDH